MKNDDIFCTTKKKLINEKKVSSERYSVNNEKLLQKDVRDNDKIFYALVVS